MFVTDVASFRKNIEGSHISEENRLRFFKRMKMNEKKKHYRRYKGCYIDREIIATFFIRW